MKCLYIEVITASPRRQRQPLALSSEAPKLQGREDAWLPQSSGSSQLLHSGGGRSVCVCEGGRLVFAPPWLRDPRVDVTDRELFRFLLLAEP